MGFCQGGVLSDGVLFDGVLSGWGFVQHSLNIHHCSVVWLSCLAFYQIFTYQDQRLP